MNKSSRRQFLKTAATVSGGILAARSVPAWGMGSAPNPEVLLRASFRPWHAN
jgi:hypothetical protein